MSQTPTFTTTDNTPPFPLLPDGLIADLRARQVAATTALGGRDIYAPLATFNGKIEAYAPLFESNMGCKDVCRLPEYEDADDYKEVFEYLANAANFLPRLCDAIEAKDATIAQLEGHVAELRSALEHAAATFEEYGLKHESKGTESGQVKARANFALSDHCRRTLATTAPVGEVKSE